VAGTATHVRAFVLIEHHGPWGVSAPGESRLPDEVKQHLGGHRAVKVLMARRHHKAHRGATYQAMVCFPARRLLLRTTFEDPAELLEVDLAAVSRGESPSGTPALSWEQVAGPLYGVCTHGRHDACCAERGRPVCAALSEIRPDETWEVSHIGGDRFAANMLVLPDGLYYGRVTPGSVGALVGRHEDGRLDLDLLRGRTTVPMPVQYAEIALRRHLGEDRLDAVRLTGRDGDTCEFTHGGERWRVTVARTLAEQASLTCSAVKQGRVPLFEAVAVERVGVPG
jgi:hypothetical protein